MAKKYPPLLLLAMYISIYVVLTFLLYTDSRPSDGPLMIGIPLPFYAGGGFCADDCGPDIVPIGLVIDALVFLVPIAFYFFKGRGNRMSAK